MYKLTEEQYNYLLPVFGLSSSNPKLHFQSGNHYFMGSHTDYLDALNRCKYIN